MKKWNVYCKDSPLVKTARGETILIAISDFYEMYGYYEITKIEEKK